MEIYQALRPLLFKFDAEVMHSLASKLMRCAINMPFGDDILNKIGGYQSQRLHSKIGKLEFYNPIGLAAGFDESGENIKALCALGFGFLELGTITKTAQEGNPKPRIWRHIQEESLQNAMGFNNIGSIAFAKKMQDMHPFCIPLGINIGKNKNIAQEYALLNYQKALEDVVHIGDYYVFNLSSPNTPNLRDLQNEKFVNELFLMAKEKTKKPLFLKISPDMGTDEMLKVCQSALDSGAKGIIATNTTIDYSLVANPKDIGGISGKALQAKSQEVFLELGKAFFKKAILISVGGIDSAQEAYKRIRMGASLIQIYSAFIFKGPRICYKISKELDSMLQSDGFENISQAIGMDL